MRPRALALTLAAGAASAVAVALLRLKRPRGRDARPAPSFQAYRCACGEELRFSGAGRHRVFWRAGADDSDPLLAARCPSCDRPLRPQREAPIPASGQSRPLRLARAGDIVVRATTFPARRLRGAR